MSSSLCNPARKWEGRRATSQALHTLNNAWKCYKVARETLGLQGSSSCGETLCSKGRLRLPYQTSISRRRARAVQCQRSCPNLPSGLKPPPAMTSACCLAFRSMSLLRGSALPLPGSLHGNGDVPTPSPRLTYGLMKMLLVNGCVSSTAFLEWTGGWGE